MRFNTFIETDATYKYILDNSARHKSIEDSKDFRLMMVVR
jgi:hypothetical protein